MTFLELLWYTPTHLIVSQRLRGEAGLQEAIEDVRWLWTTWGNR